MTSITFAEELAQLSEEELSSMFANAGSSLNPSPMELMGLIAQERIRRHACGCQDTECGFNPFS
jgi:hypothetical protein